MALRIVKLKPPTPCEPPPEPLYAARIKAALKPTHPLFQFKLERLDITTTIDFTVAFRPLVIGHQEILPERPFLFGTFPGFFFDRQQAQQHAFGVAEQYRRFEEYLFKVVSKFLSEVVHPRTLRDREALQLITPAGGIDWDKVVTYLNLATCRLEMFDRLARTEDGTLDLFLVPKDWQVRLPLGLLQRDREALAVNVAGLDRAALEAQIAEMVSKSGREQTNVKLKQHLLNGIVANLYHMAWAPL